MIESIELTRAGLYLDILGALLVALDVFLTKNDWFLLAMNNHDEFAARMTDAMLRTNAFGVDEDPNLEAMSPEERLSFWRDLGRDINILKLRLVLLKLLERGIGYYRKWGLALILLGFLFQLVATYIS